MLGGDLMMNRYVGPTYVTLKGSAAQKLLRDLSKTSKKYNPKKEAQKAKKQLLAQGYRV